MEQLGEPTPRKAPARRKCDHGRQKGRCKDCGTGYCKHNRRRPEELVQGLRHGLLPAWAPEGPVQGLHCKWTTYTIDNRQIDNSQ